MKKQTLKIANAQAFWGDQGEAAANLMRQQPDLDYITLDYLSEVSLSIMAVQRSKDPNGGYARDFVEVLKSLAPFWKQGSKVKVIANAGGLAPQSCAADCAEVLRKAGCGELKIAVIYGDDVMPMIKKDPSRSAFNHLDTKKSISTVLDRLTTANAYLGAKPIVDALLEGANIVITGRVADPSLVVAPCVAHFGWAWNDYDKIAQATVAGHLIECGTQVTGGISDHWLDLADAGNIGFPYVEVGQDAKFVLTKPLGTSGAVTIQTVKEQLLYEIGDPSAYLSPDVTLSFLSLSLQNDGKDRVAVTGAKGKAPPSTYKVSATYQDGYKAEGTLVLFGRDLKAKARRCGEMILQRMQNAGYAPARSYVEFIGGGGVIPGVVPFGSSPGHCFEPLEGVFRICIADSRMEVMEYFSKQIAPLVTVGAPGTTGYTTGRPHIRQIFGYWPCLIESAALAPKVEFIGGHREQ